MELTRRDAVAALAAGGAAVGAGSWIAREGGQLQPDDESVSIDDADLETLVAVASAVYPSVVSGIDEFVTAYSRGRIERTRDDAYVRGVGDAIELLDQRAESWHGTPYADLDGETREAMLHEVGAARVGPDPAGTDAQRVRHFLVNEVLFALYASPTGGELVGIENPRGHPGGRESYRRGSADYGRGSDDYRRGQDDYRRGQDDYRRGPDDYRRARDE